MKRNLFVTLPLCIMFFLTTSAQSKIEPLKIGDKVPDVAWTILKNYPKNEMKMSDFKGKLIILDFWNKWCTNCIQAFPEMQKLQSEFKDEIQVILVTDDKSDDLKRLFEVSPNVKANKLPMIIGDTVFRKLFPHSTVPFHVWIDQNGVLKNTTQGWNTTSASIQTFLRNGSNDIKNLGRSLAKEQRVMLSRLDQFAFAKEKLYDKLLSYSFISKFTDLDPRTGYSMGMIDSTETIDYRGCWLLNYPIPGLFRAAYTLAYVIEKPKERIAWNSVHIPTILELKDSMNVSKYYPPKDKSKQGKWVAENSYCYEVKMNQSKSTFDTVQYRERSNYIIADLERHFNIKSSIQPRKQVCYVLYRVNKNDVFKAKGGDQIIEKTANGEYVFKNASMGSLKEKIENFFGNYARPNEIPVIDDTNYDGKIDLSINVTEGQTLNDLQKRLAKYGLGIKEEVREVEFLVLTEL